MKWDKYISTKPGVSGFSFANLGLFTGFGDGIRGAVNSLILLGILGGSAALVGVYSSAYYAFGLMVQLAVGESMRLFSKAKIFYVSMLAVVVCYFMMSFSIRPMTFVALDLFVLVPLVFIGTLIPLFMADFAGKDGVGGMYGRYYFWLNVGALCSPMIAMAIADRFGERASFFAAAVMYLVAFLMFKRYKIVAEEKAPGKISPRRTVRSIMRGIRVYFRRADFARAYVVNVGYYAMNSLRGLYFPILVMEDKFGVETLGLVLTLGVIPYVILSNPVGRLARKYGQRMTNALMAVGTAAFAALSFALFFAEGRAMLALYVLTHIANALREPIHDLMFFNVANKSEQRRFYGVFNTSTNLTKFVIPLIGAAFIFVSGATRFMWLAVGLFGIISTFLLLSGSKPATIRAK